MAGVIGPTSLIGPAVAATVSRPLPLTRFFGPTPLLGAALPWPCSRKSLPFKSSVTDFVAAWLPRASSDRPTCARRLRSCAMLGPPSPWHPLPLLARSRSAASQSCRAPAGSFSQGSASSASVGGTRSAAPQASILGWPPLFEEETAKKPFCSWKKAFPRTIPWRDARPRSSGRRRARRSTSSRGTFASPVSRAAPDTMPCSASLRASSAPSRSEQSSDRRAPRTRASAWAQAWRALWRSSACTGSAGAACALCSPMRSPATRREKKASSAAYCL
mmetsp:Transcript_116155/g.306959  ORF Transcript_116155/g.306959 Transcript_116155/m.306959 type:complete len:275 (+) Transcript_116155:483-1307(+)